MFHYFSIFVLTLSIITICANSSEEAGWLFPNGNSKFLYTKISPEVQVKTVQELIERLLPSGHDEFIIQISSNLTGSIYQDAFQLESNSSSTSNKVIITGTTGVAAAFGFHYYLKYYCNCHVSWEGFQLNLPLKLPSVSLTKVLQDRFRYYQNACTESYSFVWWNWTRWETHIDWMALNGINLPLASVGQEAIWIKVFYELGLSIQEIEDYLTGPVFLAWWRMGNIQKWGGPISQHFVAEKLKLLHKIVQRMRNFGMLPILPAFSGTVPIALKQYYPNSTFTQHSNWSNFNSTYQPYFLDPTDPLYVDIGQRFVTKMTAEFGTDHLYSCDTFNENRPSKNDTNYLRLAASKTYEAMRIVDSEAVWVMQAWLFNSDASFWAKDRVKSYLSGVDQGNLILLDLQADVNPAYLRFESFYNHSFIWCMLQNFGGASVLFGNMELINLGIPTAKNLSNSLIGIGMAPEGINQNYIMYDFMSEMTLNKSPVDTKKWIVQYSTRRYGINHKLLTDSWLILEASVYNAFPWSRSNAHTIISARPGLNRTESHWYKMSDVAHVVENFISIGPNLTKSPLFSHDLVDFTRQFIQHTVELVYIQLLQVYYQQNVTEFTTWSNKLLDALNDLDIILSTNSHFIVGNWVKDAESWGQTDLERDLLRFNSLNQITLWGPSGEIVDYAVKQWAGIVKHYNQKRWSLFIHELNTSLANNQTFNTKKFNQIVLEQVEIPFTNSPSTLFPIEPKGNSLTEASRIYLKWKDLFYFCLENPYKYDKRKRRRGQKMITKTKYHLKMSKKLKNKNFAQVYLKSMLQ